MKRIYFNVIVQQSTYNESIMMAAIPKNLFGENLPAIFEVQAFLMEATVFTGTYPQIKINTDTIKDVTDEHTGKGVEGIITEAVWYNKTKEIQDYLGISIEKK